MPRPFRRPWRGRAPEAVVQELAELNRSHGVSAFNFVDDDFLGPPAHAEERALAFARAVTRRGLRIGFGAQLRPHVLSAPAIAAPSRAGLAWAFVGVESDDPATLREWRRPPLAGDVWSAIARLRRHRVEVAVGTILFHPGATLDGVRRFAALLARHHLLNYRTATSRLHLLPGSRLYEQCHRQNAIPSEARGPFTPPLRQAAVESLFGYLAQSLAPLRPSWVQAACQLPGLVSQHRARRPVAGQLRAVRSVLQQLDGWVAGIVATLTRPAGALDISAKWLAHARIGSRNLALEACDRLQQEGLVSDPRQLRDAIRLEAA